MHLWNSCTCLTGCPGWAVGGVCGGSMEIWEVWTHNTHCETHHSSLREATRVWGEKRCYADWRNVFNFLWQVLVAQLFSFTMLWLCGTCLLNNQTLRKHKHTLTRRERNKAAQSGSEGVITMNTTSKVQDSTTTDSVYLGLSFKPNQIVNWFAWKVCLYCNLNRFKLAAKAAFVILIYFSFISIVNFFYNSCV